MPAGRSRNSYIDGLLAVKRFSRFSNAGGRAVNRRAALLGLVGTRYPRAAGPRGPSRGQSMYSLHAPKKNLT